MIVQLVVVSGTREGQIVPITVEKFIIGRATDCHLRSRSELVSRYHCAILVSNGAIVRDLGSRNGVKLNGEKISMDHALKNGDHLTVGPLEFRVHIAAGDHASTGGTGGDGYQLSTASGELCAEPTDPTAIIRNEKALNQEEQ